MIEAGQEEIKISEEFIERLKSRDKRWVDIEMAIKLEAELRDSLAIKLVLEHVNFEAVDALEKLASVTPNDVNAIVALQASVKRARIIGNTLEALRRRGAIAQQQIEEEGEISSS